MVNRFGIQPFCQLERFFRRVAGERVRVLDDFGCVWKIIEREHLKLPAEDGADFRDLVGVARGDEQRRHAPRLAKSFLLASLTEKISDSKSRHEITTVAGAGVLFSRRRKSSGCRHERTRRALPSHAARARDAAHQWRGCLRRAARLAVSLQDSGDG